jgi:hypothetical protein
MSNEEIRRVLYVLWKEQSDLVEHYKTMLEESKIELEKAQKAYQAVCEHSDWRLVPRSWQMEMCKSCGIRRGVPGAFRN